MNKERLLVFLGTKYHQEIYHVENYLPLYLSKYANIYCIEYPYFSNFISFITGKLKLFEKVSNSQFIYHSIGILPFGRICWLFNFINHLFNFYVYSWYFRLSELKLRIISFTPEISLLPILTKYPTYYFVVDNYISLPWWKNYLKKNQFRMLERKLIRHVTKIICTSSTLCNKYCTLNSNTYEWQIPSDNESYFSLKKTKNMIPDDIKSITRPIVGFIGGLYPWRIDMDLLAYILSRCSNISFVFLGTIDLNNKKIRKLIGFKNVHVLGNKRVYSLPPYILQFDVCIIPYRIDNYGVYAYPVKIMEYLALGKPVVTTDLPSIRHLVNQKLIFCAVNKESFVDLIRKAVSEKKEAGLIEKRRITAKYNSWNNRIKGFLRLIDLN